MSDARGDDRLDRLLLTQEIAQFLYVEAELLDERRHDEWLALLAEDIRYWMPMRRNVKFGDTAREFTRETEDISWFDEGKDTLTRRVRQIQTGIHWAEEPQSRITHMVSNVQLLSVALAEVDDWDGLRKQFDDAHERAYGYAAPDVEVQLLNLRLTVVFPLERPRLPQLERRTSGAVPYQTRTIYSMLAGESRAFRVYQRGDLRPGDAFDGPAAIEEPGTTTIIDAADRLSVEDHGCLIIELNATATARNR